MYRFDAEVWLSELSTAAWYFLTVPDDVSDEIEAQAPDLPGFGSVRVEATIGATTWQTSVFPDTKRGAYVLPVKKAVRTAEDLDEGTTATVTLRPLLDPTDP